MKKLTTLFILLLTAVLVINAQPPQAFKYKAIARNKYGMLIINQQVAIRISILQGSETGPAMFIETHTPVSNLFGVIELEIGRGTPVSGAFSNIDWGTSDYYIKIEMDPKNKPVKDYTVIGTSQLLSVPYALYAGHVQNSDDNDADPFNELITNAYLSGTMLCIQEGGTTTLIDLSGLQEGFEDADADPENEIQDLQLVDNKLTITKNGTATEIDLSVYLDNTDTHLTEAEVDAMVENNGYLKGIAWADIPDVPADIADGDDNTQLSEVEVDAMVANNGYLTSEVDGSVTNEIQDINLIGHMLAISGGSTVQLPDSVNDADHDPFNELQELVLNGTELTITDKNTVDLAVLQDGVNDADADPTNELQVLSIGHDTIYLSEGGYVKLPASMGFSGDYNDLVNKPDVLTSPNTLLGKDAGLNALQTRYIIAIGDSSLFHNGIGEQVYYHGTENTAIGFKSLFNNTTGHNNTANGSKALYSNTTGGINTAIGSLALFSNITGDYNIAVGAITLFNNTTGLANTALGSLVLSRNTSGSLNTASGYQALNFNTTGSFNTAYGDGALRSNSTGHSNTAVGTSALYGNSTRCNLVAIGDSALYNNGEGASTKEQGTGNTALGSKALRSNTIGYGNTATGYNALYHNNTGLGNTSNGYLALYSNTSGRSNTANGSYALYRNTTGEGNTSSGYYALNRNTEGYYNTASGYMALYLNTTGTYNIAIGSNSLFYNTTGLYNSASGSYALHLNTAGESNTANGYNALCYNKTGSNNTAVGAYAGPADDYTELINTSAFGYFAQVSANNSIRIGNTSITRIEGQVNFSATSDGRFKTNITDNVPGLNFITKLRPVTFHWDIHKLDAFMGIPDSIYAQSSKMEQARLDKESKVYTGFVAQEVEEAAKACGYDFSGIIKPENEKSQYSLSYAEFVVPLVKALQEQQAIIEELKARIEVLEGK
jgi:hypothetical protein